MSIQSDYQDKQQEYDLFKDKLSKKSKFSVIKSITKNVFDNLPIILFVISLTMVFFTFFLGFTPIYNMTHPHVPANEKSFNLKTPYHQDLMDANIQNLQIEKNSQNVYTVTYETFDMGEKSFNYAKTTDMPSYKIRIINNKTEMDNIQSDLKDPDLLNSQLMINEIKQAINQVSLNEEQRSENAFKQRTQENQNAIHQAKTAWGDLYEPVKKLLFYYQITDLDIQKNKTNYTVFARFSDGTRFTRSYDFGYQDTVNIIPAQYTLSLNLKDDYNNYFGEKQMVSEGLEKMQGNLNLDMSRAQNELYPELAFLMSRMRQSKMWIELYHYKEISYSKNELKEFMSVRPYEKDAQQLVNRLLLTMHDNSLLYQESYGKGRILNNYKISKFLDKKSIYEEEPSRAVAMLNYMKAYGITIDPVRVCNAYNKISENKLTQTDMLFLTQALNGLSPKRVCE